MPRIVIDEAQLAALRLGKMLKITLADGRPIEIVLQPPPDPPQAREFLSRRNNRK